MLELLESVAESGVIWGSACGLLSVGVVFISFGFKFILMVVL